MSAPKGNKYAIGNNGGRPPYYESATDLVAACDAYFEYIQGESHIQIKGKGKTRKQFKVWDREPEPATVTGLALFLGFESKQSLYDYEQKQEFSYPIKKARLRIEHEYEKKLHGDKNTGAIFALKNMDWQDRVQSQLTGPDGGPIKTESTVLILPSNGRELIKPDGNK